MFSTDVHSLQNVQCAAKEGVGATGSFHTSIVSVLRSDHLEQG